MGRLNEGIDHNQRTVLLKPGLFCTPDFDPAVENRSASSQHIAFGGLQRDPRALFVHVDQRSFVDSLKARDRIPGLVAIHVPSI